MLQLRQSWQVTAIVTAGCGFPSFPAVQPPPGARVRQPRKMGIIQPMTPINSLDDSLQAQGANPSWQEAAGARILDASHQRERVNEAAINTACQSAKPPGTSSPETLCAIRPTSSKAKAWT